MSDKAFTDTVMFDFGVSPSAIVSGVVLCVDLLYLHLSFQKDFHKS